MASTHDRGVIWIREVQIGCSISHIIPAITTSYMQTPVFIDSLIQYSPCPPHLWGSNREKVLCRREQPPIQSKWLPATPTCHVELALPPILKVWNFYTRLPLRIPQGNGCTAHILCFSFCLPLWISGNKKLLSIACQRRMMNDCCWHCINEMSNEERTSVALCTWTINRQSLGLLQNNVFVLQQGHLSKLVCRYSWLSFRTTEILALEILNTIFLTEATIAVDIQFFLKFQDSVPERKPERPPNCSHNRRDVVLHLCF